MRQVYVMGTIILAARYYATRDTRAGTSQSISLSAVHEFSAHAFNRQARVLTSPSAQCYGSEQLIGAQAEILDTLNYDISHHVGCWSCHFSTRNVQPGTLIVEWVDLLLLLSSPLIPDGQNGSIFGGKISDSGVHR